MARFMLIPDIHGRQDLMYIGAQEWQEKTGKELTAILQSGDFETLRSEADFAHYFAPDEHKRVSDFDHYLKNGNAPIPTYFIGGNHEAWNVLAPFNEGGELAKNIHYLGRQGIVDIAGIRIGGLTGIYSPRNFNTPLPDEPDETWKYYRKEEIDALNTAAKKEGLDILLLHDWIKPYRNLEITTAHGVPENFQQSDDPTPTMELVNTIAPKLVSMGHMHTSYLDATLAARGRDTRVFGLSLFKEHPDFHSAKIVEFEPGGEPIVLDETFTYGDPVREAQQYMQGGR